MDVIEAKKDTHLNNAKLSPQIKSNASCSFHHHADAGSRSLSLSSLARADSRTRERSLVLSHRRSIASRRRDGCNSTTDVIKRSEALQRLA
eukprot:scaffold1924_cov140-Skeletonema_menzelii.AAC.6